MSLTEAKIEKKLVAYCRQRGLLSYKFTSPANRGVPDRVIMGNNRIMFLELKREGNTLTELQKREIARINAAGIHCTWAVGYANAKAAVDDFFDSAAGMI
jgi:hypothetical protein